MTTATTPSDAGAASKPARKQSKVFANLQRLGRSLMLPIAALPAAGILLRLGQDDLLGAIPGFGQWAAVISAAGDGIFSWLPLIFAVGIAIGWAKKSDGSTALAAVIGYMVLYTVFAAMSPIVLGSEKNAAGKVPAIDFGVLGGIVMGLVAATLWQRFHRTQLPDFIGFFSGRRLVPILSSVAGLVIGIFMAFVYIPFNVAITWVGEQAASNSVAGGGLFGLINRLLVPTGLHQLLNSVVWFIVGDYEGAHGDLNRFFAGDASAGTFMTGFFPIMMFGLPAAAFAIWRNAKPKQRKVVGGIMISAALTAFMTGITEPLEYSFMFVAWPLYLVHAVLTGTSLALVNALGIHDGFTFSAGAIDYLLNFGKAQRAIWLVPIGLGYAAIYYFLFGFVIRRWNLRTPGREAEADEGAESVEAATRD